MIDFSRRSSFLAAFLIFWFISATINKDTRKGASILTIILAWYLAAQAQQPHFDSLSSLDFARDKQIAGAAITQTDPNHPVEVFYGSAAYNNIKEMISGAGITVYPEDKVETVPPPAMGLGSQIIITRATPVQVIDAKKSTTYRTWQTTVGDLLQEKAIELLGQDSVSPATSSTLSYAMKITITRVAEVEVTEKQPIEFATIVKNDSSRYRGDPDVIEQQGKNGQKIMTYQVRREDGVEVSRKLINTDTTALQNKIISHGTKIKIKQTISGRATWYNSRYNAASHLWPKGTHIRVTNPKNGKSIETVVDDYMESSQSVVDLKLSLFQQLADPYGTMPSLTVDWILN